MSQDKRPSRCIRNNPFGFTFLNTTCTEVNLVANYIEVFCLIHLLKVPRNKKVLLRERKRHTARQVASARYTALSNGGCTPGTPPHHPDLARVTPPSTIHTWLGYPPHHPIHTWPGYPPTIQTLLGYPPPHHKDLGWCTPLPSSGMGYSPVSVDRHTVSCQNITFPGTSYVGGNESCLNFAI